MKRESELQNDWIDRLENPEQSWIYSMDEFSALQLRNPTNKTKKRGAVISTAQQIMQMIIDGASLKEIGLGEPIHEHTGEQSALLENDPELKEKHLIDAHNGAEDHDSHKRFEV